MIYGIGIDIVRTDRIKAVVERWGNKFLERVFVSEEISYSYERKTPYLSLAVRFAAKEALIKAIGSEVPVSFTDIKIINLEAGKPVIEVSGGLEKFFGIKKIKTAHLSLSHEREYGIACVILEQ